MSNNVNKSLSDIDGKLLAASKGSAIDSRKDSKNMIELGKNTTTNGFKLTNSTLETAGRPGQVTELLLAA